jgi:hypothetical protein
MAVGDLRHVIIISLYAIASTVKSIGISMGDTFLLEYRYRDTLLSIHQLPLLTKVTLQKLRRLSLHYVQRDALQWQHMGIAAACVTLDITHKFCSILGAGLLV